MAYESFTHRKIHETEGVKLYMSSLSTAFLHYTYSLRMLMMQLQINDMQNGRKHSTANVHSK